MALKQIIITQDYALDHLRMEAMHLANRYNLNIYSKDTCNWKLDGYVKAYEDLSLLDEGRDRHDIFSIFEENIDQ